MPLMLLGLVFVIGLFAYYMISTGTGGSRKNAEEGSRRPAQDHKPKDQGPKDDELKTEENVIYLPTDIEEAKRRHRKNR